MTPDEFTYAILDAYEGSDPDKIHDRVDALMEETLISLGYGDGIELALDMERRAAGI
jgi:hypothetical protein